MNSKKMIYADWAATASLHPKAKAELGRWLEEAGPANPSSVHSYGMAAADRLTAARKTITDAAGWDGKSPSSPAERKAWHWPCIHWSDDLSKAAKDG